MNPYKHIKHQKQIINDMTFELKYQKDKQKAVNRINTLIDTVNAFESMLKDKYYTNAIETLLYARIYSQLMGNITKEEIDIHSIVDNIEKDIYYGAAVKKMEVIGVLEHKEMQEKTKSFNFDTFANWDKMLTDLINEFKTSIAWTK